MTWGSKATLSAKLNPVLGSIPVVMDSVDEPSMYTALSIPGYVVLHSGGVGLSQRWDGLPVVAEEVEAEGVGSPSVGKSMLVDSKGGQDEY